MRLAKSAARSSTRTPSSEALEVEGKGDSQEEVPEDNRLTERQFLKQAIKRSRRAVCEESGTQVDFNIIDSGVLVEYEKDRTSLTWSSEKVGTSLLSSVMGLSEREVKSVTMGYRISGAYGVHMIATDETDLCEDDSIVVFTTRRLLVSNACVAISPTRPKIGKFPTSTALHLENWIIAIGPALRCVRICSLIPCIGSYPRLVADGREQPPNRLVYSTMVYGDIGVLASGKSERIVEKISDVSSLEKGEIEARTLDPTKLSELWTRVCVLSGTSRVFCDRRLSESEFWRHEALDDGVVIYSQKFEVSGELTFGLQIHPKPEIRASRWVSKAGLKNLPLLEYCTGCSAVWINGFWKSGNIVSVVLGGLTHFQNAYPEEARIFMRIFTEIMKDLVAGNYRSASHGILVHLLQRPRCADFLKAMSHAASQFSKNRKQLSGQLEKISDCPLAGAMFVAVGLAERSNFSDEYLGMELGNLGEKPASMMIPGPLVAEVWRLRGRWHEAAEVLSRIAVMGWKWVRDGRPVDCDEPVSVYLRLSSPFDSDGVESLTRVLCALSELALLNSAGPGAYSAVSLRKSRRYTPHEARWESSLSTILEIIRPAKVERWDKADSTVLNFLSTDERCFAQSLLSVATRSLQVEGEASSFSETQLRLYKHVPVWPVAEKRKNEANPEEFGRLLNEYSSYLNAAVGELDFSPSPAVSLDFSNKNSQSVDEIEAEAAALLAKHDLPAPIFDDEDEIEFALASLRDD